MVEETNNTEIDMSETLRRFLRREETGKNRKNKDFKSRNKELNEEKFLKTKKNLRSKVKMTQTRMKKKRRKLEIRVMLMK